MDKALVGMALVSSVVACLPLMLRIPLIRDESNCRLCEALDETAVTQAMIFAFATTVPMLVDVMTYFIHKDSFYYFERLTLLCACNFPLLITYLSLQQDEIKAANVFICLYSAQSIWIGAALFNGLASSQSKIWKRWRLYVLFGLICISQGLTPFTQLQGKAGYGILCLTNVAFTLCIVAYLFMYCNYLRQVVDHNEELVSTTNEYLPILCATIMICYGIGASLPQQLYSVTYPEDVNKACLVFMLVMTSVLTVVTTLLPGRIARSRVREVESNLETKKTFVRYIGHEIRTPLNVASIGLELLATLYQTSPRSPERPHCTSSVAPRNADDDSRNEKGAKQKGAEGVTRKSNNSDNADDYSGTSSAASPQLTCHTTTHTVASADNNANNNYSGVASPDNNVTAPTIVRNFTGGTSGTGGSTHEIEDRQSSEPLSSSIKNNLNTNNMNTKSASDKDDNPLIERTTSLDYDTMKQDRDTVLQEVRNAIALSTNILNDLLSYEKLDSNNMTVESTYLDIHHLMTSSLSMFAMQAESKHIRFTVQVDRDLPLLYGDEYKLRQVLCNLASNAMKFTPVNGSVAVRVKKDSRKPQQYLMIEFQDNGVGIAKKNLPKVFKKIIQFDANQNQGGAGSGLGLFITRGLVELHGGSVSVHSDGLGSGCLFKVRLPFDRSKLHHIYNYRSRPGSEMEIGLLSMSMPLAAIGEIFGGWGLASERKHSSGHTSHTNSRRKGGGGGGDIEMANLNSRNNSSSCEDTNVLVNMNTLRYKPQPSVEATTDTMSRDALSLKNGAAVVVNNINFGIDPELEDEDDLRGGMRPVVVNHEHATYFVATSDPNSGGGFFGRTNQAKVAPAANEAALRILEAGSIESTSLSYPDARSNGSGLTNFSAGSGSGTTIVLAMAAPAPIAPAPHSGRTTSDGIASQAAPPRSQATSRRLDSSGTSERGTPPPSQSVKNNNVPSLLLQTRRNSGGNSNSVSISHHFAASPDENGPVPRLMSGDYPSNYGTPSPVSAGSSSGKVVPHNATGSGRESPNTIRPNTVRSMASGGRWLEGMNALLVDDSTSSLKMLSILLRRHGCTSVTAGDGDVAVAIVHDYLKTHGRLVTTPIPAANVNNPSSSKSVSVSLTSFSRKGKDKDKDKDNSSNNSTSHKSVVASPSVGNNGSNNASPVASPAPSTGGQGSNLQIDFVLMDNFMPTLCGPAACREMRRLGYYQPILGLTGHALDDDVAAYRAAGADDVLVKPLDLSLLQAKLKRLLPNINV
jgi:signal transduction histidine kinase